MKAQTKALVASVVVIALALSAVSGITYSWFSDSEEAEINITTGKVSYDLEITTFEDKTSGTSHATATASTETPYSFGCTATAAYNTTSGTEVTLSNLADNDSLKVSFKITNTSTIDTVYRVSAATSGTLSKYLVNTFEFDGSSVTDCTDWIKVPAPSNSATVTGSLTITFNSDNAANGSDGTAAIDLKVEAYQANTPASNLPSFTVVQTVSANDEVSKTFENSSSTSSSVSSASVSFTAPSDGDYSISSISTSADSSYTIQQGNTDKTVITGIAVSATNGSSTINLSSQKATLTFVLDSSLVTAGSPNTLASGFTIVHQDANGDLKDFTLSAQSSGTTLGTAGQYIITQDTAGGTYTMELYVDGFSAYLMVVDADASVTTEDKTTYYEHLTGTGGAIESTANGSAIKLLRDVSIVDDENQYYINSTAVIDLNGYTLTIYRINLGKQATGTTSDAATGNLTLKNGKLVAEINTEATAGIATEAGSTLVLQNVNYTAAQSGVLARGDTAKVTIENSTITAGFYGVGTNAQSALNCGIEITIENSTITTTNALPEYGDCAVILNVEGDLTITDSTLNAHRQCLVVRAGDAEVSGTTFNYDQADATYKNEIAWDTGNGVSSAAIVAGNIGNGYGYADAVIVLNDCTVNLPDSSKALVVAQDGKNGMTVSVRLDGDCSTIQESMYTLAGEDGYQKVSESETLIGLEARIDATIGADSKVTGKVWNPELKQNTDVSCRAMTVTLDFTNVSTCNGTNISGQRVTVDAYTATSSTGRLASIIGLQINMPGITLASSCWTFNSAVKATVVFSGVSEDPGALIGFCQILSISPVASSYNYSEKTLTVEFSFDKIMNSGETIQFDIVPALALIDGTYYASIYQIPNDSQFKLLQDYGDYSAGDTCKVSNYILTKVNETD